jgi:aminopeptidase N
VHYHGLPLAFGHLPGDLLAIALPDSVPFGNMDSLTVWYQGQPTGTGFGSFIQETHNSAPIIWTLSEPYGAKDWWPCKNGLNDKADSIDITITTPDTYTSTTNGLLVDEQVLNGKRTTTWKHRYPIATYLVAFAATNYVVIKDEVQLGNTLIQHWSLNA